MGCPVWRLWADVRDCGALERVAATRSVLARHVRVGDRWEEAVRHWRRGLGESISVMTVLGADEPQPGRDPVALLVWTGSPGRTPAERAAARPPTGRVVLS